MGHATVDDEVVVLYDGDAVHLVGVLALGAHVDRHSLEMARLADLTALHLAVLDLDLRIVEDIMVVIDILNNLNIAVLALLLRLRRAASPLVDAVQTLAAAHRESSDRLLLSRMVIRVS